MLRARFGRAGHVVLKRAFDADDGDKCRKTTWIVPFGALKPFARQINRAPRATYHLLENGHLDADRVGGRWVSTPRRLREQFAGRSGKLAAFSVAKAPEVREAGRSEVER